MDELEQELLEYICATCNLDEGEASAMESDSPLIGPESPLGTDSIDALEIAVAIQRRYGARMDSANTSREVLQSLATLAEYVRKHRLF